MLQKFAKKVAFALIGQGAPVPELILSRVQEYAQIKSLLDTLAINCVIDAGANQGQTVRLLRGLGFKGYIYSFEPQRRMYTVLERAFRKDPKWKGFQVALGAAPQALQLNVNPESNEMTSLLNFHHQPQGMSEEIVQVIPLDSLFSSLMKPIANPRVFLKIDTEGYDLNVFRGAANSLPDILALQAEVFVHPVYKQAPHYLEALREYEQAGFELVNLSLVTRTECGDIMCMNSLMKRSHELEARG
jgi:FkbM family methyltransferase